MEQHESDSNIPMLVPVDHSATKTPGSNSLAPDCRVNTDHGKKYWEAAEADVNSMLGGVPLVEGFSHVSRVDLQGSRSFLAKLGIGNKQGRRSVGSALEGGAGVGRVTEGLLLDVAESVDVIEPVAKFTASLQDKHGVRKVFNVGLEEWQPIDGTKYDLIWNQWCLGYLTDEQLVQYLKRCKVALNPNKGLIVVKENISTSGIDLFDDGDSSVTREDRKYQNLFREAGLRVIKADTQKGFPKTSPRRLFPVKMYALKPADP
ncbi:hypothetical protein DL766_004140 [Monosporascus sp. MC13-8B]|uniref:Alpha N-terminal protein methyltransferase 1 n=1 Tax=Monosporascus cannonballus TaxID=155416 RepID=A0ABY0H6H4_9PEZI|nr:hypothetical protein DL762_005950 [Monosporascus cannonballus]RYP01659.1 hypothetical protein DL763_000048 [Monosporascus cannonballus]RYP32030.1 hypothetical protein DL766_004140 [Monosporascus sp. MC13-8B]